MLEQSIDLRGRRALVCGASSGIGEATVRTLQAQGAEVIALARNETRLKRLANDLERVHYLAIDINDHVKLREAVQTELDGRGPIDILINNSSGPKGGAISEAAPEEFTMALHQHLLSSHLLVQLLIPGMRERGYGRIINIISTSVYAPIAGLGVSNTIRAAMASWAKTLAGEVGQHAITVNSVLPGYTSTERLKALISVAAGKTGKSEEAIIAEWKATVPLRRFAVASEISSVIGFLASPAASYVHGVAIPVDGGRLPMI